MDEFVDFGSGYQASSRESAEEMADFIEKWLGNPLLKRILGYTTRRCTCGRRIELALKKYAGEDVELCFRCNLAYQIIRKVLDGIIHKVGDSKESVIEHLRDPMWRKGLSSVLEGISKYGPVKPFTAYAPFLIVWNFTNACNLRCAHCYQNAEKKAPDELSTEEALRAVDILADAGVAYIAMSGGEPLVRKDFFTVAERIKENEMAMSLATNGTLLTEEVVRKLEKLNCLFVQISLDGARPETHNTFRGRQSFERTIQGIKNAVNSSMTVGIATTVTKHNYHEVMDIIDLAEKLGVDIFMHYNFIPTGRGKDIIQLDLTPEEREDLLNRMASMTHSRKISLLSTAPQYSRACRDFNTLSLTHFDTFGQKGENIDFLAEFVGGCGTGRLYCALQPNGDIIPCVFMPIVVGNILKDDFIDVWHNSPVFIDIRDRDAFGGCGTCPELKICGGCRARAYGYYRDLKGPDPGCILNRDYWARLSSIEVSRGDATA